MATVVIQRRQNKNGVSYLVQYRDPYTGQKKHYKSFRKKRDADHARNDLRQILDSGELPKKKMRLRVMTFAQVADLWKKELDDRVELEEISKATYENYTINLRTCQKVLGKMLLFEVSEQVILDYRKRLARDVSNVNANRILFIIKQVMKKGVAEGAIKASPAEGIRYLSEKKHARNKFLLPPQLDTLIAAAGQGKTKFYLPALICLGAEHGASKQECLSLRWSDVDFEYNGIGLIRLFRTKNGHERTEFLMPRTKQHLQQWREHLQRKRDKLGLKSEKNGFVFCRIDGTPLGSFRKAFQVACQAAGIQDFHFHDLRHTFCSNLILSGADLKDAKEMIGHADLSMTDRYSHLTAQHKLLMQRQLVEHYTGAEV